MLLKTWHLPVLTCFSRAIFQVLIGYTSKRQLSLTPTRAGPRAEGGGRGNRGSRFHRRLQYSHCKGFLGAFEQSKQMVKEHKPLPLGTAEGKQDSSLQMWKRLIWRREVRFVLNELVLGAHLPPMSRFRYLYSQRPNCQKRMTVLKSKSIIKRLYWSTFKVPSTPEILWGAMARGTAYPVSSFLFSIPPVWFQELSPETHNDWFSDYCMTLD